MIFASSNIGKVNEVKKILNREIKSLNDLEEEFDIDETGNTFLENAILKAKFIYDKTKIPSIADDSGLEIDALDGFPGVKTHRFLDGTDSDRNQEILKLMKDKKDRTCYFTCCMAYFDGINLKTFEYKLKGKIAEIEKINNGFGFDSIFLYNGKYLSNMSMEEKNNISPRAIVLKKLSNFLQKNIDLWN